jgi:hypothetical protein
MNKMNDDLSAFMWDAFTALSVNGITGDYVEFGSEGANSIRLAYEVASLTPVNRHLWAFDSFDGLPETADQRDDHPAFTRGYDQGGIEAFHARCAQHGIPREAYTAVQGFFAETLPPLGSDGPPNDIALAYVDCNLYSSTVSTLEFLSPRLKHGMIVAFDDYFCWTATGVSGERLALHQFLESHPQWHFERFKDPTWGAVSYVVESRDALRA